MNFPTFTIELYDQFGNAHYIPCNEYQYDAATRVIQLFEFGGGFEDVIEEGKTKERAIMNLAGIFNDVAGFRVYEVEHEQESRSEV